MEKLLIFSHDNDTAPFASLRHVTDEIVRPDRHECTPFPTYFLLWGVRGGAINTS